MENKLLKELYDYFYVRPELDEQENEVEECHKALIAALEKPERKHGGSQSNCTTMKTSAHSPVGPGERALIVYGKTKYKMSLGSSRKAAQAFCL